MNCDNWNLIVSEYEKDIDSFYEFNGELYVFVGLIHGSSDYFYGMANHKTGRLLMCSCVGSIEGHGFKPLKES